jgi:hypothetical protein
MVICKGRDLAGFIGIRRYEHERRPGWPFRTSGAPVLRLHHAGYIFRAHFTNQDLPGYDGIVVIHRATVWRFCGGVSKGAVPWHSAGKAKVIIKGRGRLEHETVVG